ncbi:Hemolysin, chromosomal [Flavimaricola marinus]|uniref:Hemolysin, chromosomal n=2 Tax=Flavimaricola marinus TaxID=1819565 RepID=A0A238LNL9_9RHOB|nr:Hemolysin, chromosomal [Flavimaricola marinus]
MNDGDAYGIMTEEMFGGILINQSDFADFSQDYDDLGLSFVRYPGGTFAEDGIVINGEVGFSSGTIIFDDMTGDRSHLAYDLTFPELFNPELLTNDELDGGTNDYASLSEAMAYCVTDGTSLAIILPTTRYFSGVDLTSETEMVEMVALAEQDLRVFLERLVTGEYNNGEYPVPLILEIGNETYGSPIEYAILAQVYIETIEEVLGNTDIEYEIAFQMNVGSVQFQSLYDQSYFDQYFDDDGNALIPQLTGFDFDPDAAYSYGERILLIEEMMAHILGDSITDIDLLRHHFLGVDADVLDDENSTLYQRDDILQYWRDEIDENGGNSSDVDYYVSAWTTDSSNSGNAPAGLAAASNTLLLYTHFLEMGVDLAAAWGVNGSERFWPENSPTTVLTFSDQEGVTPGAAIIAMLTDDVIGLTHIESDVDQVLDKDDPADYLEFIYTSETVTVIFYSVGELDGLTLNLEVDLSEFGYFTFATVENLGTEDGTSYGLAVVEETYQILEDSTVSITFDQSWEVVKIVAQNDGIEGSEASDVIEGSADRDFISGNAGDDHLSGWGGEDTILGDAGNDIIYGNAGSDNLYGGQGSDRIYGADGGDVISGGAGSDTLSGQNGDDILSGGSGSDTIYGGAGNDIIYAGEKDIGSSFQDISEAEKAPSDIGDWWEELYELVDANLVSGGQGDDLLVGSRGVDTFVFDAGNDVIQSHQEGLDTLMIDAVALGLVPGSFDQLAGLVEETVDGLFLDFGSGNSLLLSGVGSWSDISSDVIF